MNALANLVRVRLVVVETTRYERVVEMPAPIFKDLQGRLANPATQPEAAEEAANHLVDSFVDRLGDDVSEQVTVEAFEQLGAAGAGDRP